MSGWLYLIRNKDIYKIGITKNFSNRMRQLKPDNVIAKLYTSDYIKLEKELHNRYKEYRIPQTEYFRLENSHLREIKNRISKLDYRMIVNVMIFIRSLLMLFIIFFLNFLLLSLNINDPKIIIINSFLFSEKITLLFSFFSLIIPSGKNFIFLNELKYRSIRSIVYLFFAIFFRITYLHLT